MGMILYIRRATDDDLHSLRSDPTSIVEFFFEPAARTNGDLIDFDKAWQAVHFILSGAEYYSDDPLAAILSQGETIGGDMGYGPAWIIPHERLFAFDVALRGLSDDDIRSRYDPKALVENDIYGFSNCLEFPEESLVYIMQGIPALRQFAERCSSTGASALVAIT